VAKYWHPSRNEPLKPSDVTPGVHTRVWWRCFKSANHIWQAKIYIMVLAWKQGRSGCPFCFKNRTITKGNLGTKYPEGAKHFHPELNKPKTAEDIMAGTQKKYWWVCIKDSDHVWQAPANNVVSSRNTSTKGCPLCHHKR